MTTFLTFIGGVALGILATLFILSNSLSNIIDRMREAERELDNYKKGNNER
jgi:hypothetical protein